MLKFDTSRLHVLYGAYLVLIFKGKDLDLLFKLLKLGVQFLQVI